MKSISITYKKMHGLSLIEMMVSMVLGLFLIGGLTTMYIGSKKSDKVRSEVSNMEENARIALSSLRSAIQHAGYSSVENIPLDKAFQTPDDGVIQNENCRDSNGVMVTNTNLITPPSEFLGYTVDNSLSDRITVISRADSPDKGPVFKDCAGGEYNKNTSKQIACSTDPVNGMDNIWKSKIYNGVYINRSDKTLRCFGSRSGPGSIVLAENIENLQIRYGVTRNNRTTYKNATQVEASNQWESVTSVQAAILVGSNNDVLELPETHNFQVLDEAISLAEDRKLYRVYTTTVYLPNNNRRELSETTGGEAASR